MDGRKTKETKAWLKKIQGNYTNKCKHKKE
jgi:hypothetical protein